MRVIENARLLGFALNKLGSSSNEIYAIKNASSPW